MSGLDEHLEDLFAEFTELHAAGEVPEPVEFVQRAGVGGPRLRELIATYLTETEPVLPGAGAGRRLATRFDPDSGVVEDLFAEFTELHAAGEVPEPVEFVQRAGVGGPRLRELIATYLTETPPVPPTALAARKLAEACEPSSSAPRPSEELAALDTDRPSDGTWMEFLRRELRTWIVAGRDSRHEILARISADLPVLHLKGQAPLHQESRKRERSWVFPLDHPAGAQVEIKNDSCLLTIFCLPAQFVGSRPLVALPKAAFANTPRLAWAGHEHHLPDGIALAEENVRDRRELQIFLGRLGSENEGSFSRLFAEVCVIGAESDLPRVLESRKQDAAAKTQGGESLTEQAVARTKEGDPEGLSYLYIAYSTDVFRYVAGLVRDRHEAEDLTLGVFKALMTTIKRYEQREVPFDAWILRVARNAALDRLRERRAIPTEEVRLADTGHVQTSVERGRALRQALEELPEDQREVLVLRHIVGLSPVTIADTLDKTESLVRRLHHRGRRTLSELAETRGIGGGDFERDLRDIVELPALGWSPAQR
jgi:RNA polymerase sigma-70 factor, ECF subfamily